MPRGIGLTYDGMRRCQRLPELRTPLIPRDRRELHQRLCPRGAANLRANWASWLERPSNEVDGL